MKEKNMMDAKCRMLIETGELTKKAIIAVTCVAIANGIGEIFPAVGRGGDAHDLKAELAETLLETAKALGKAYDEIYKAVEIVMENEGADKEEADENRG